MKSNEKNWLPHLKGVVPSSAYGYKSCIYALALEGWRRGLKLTFINKFDTESTPKIIFSLSDGENEQQFKISRSNSVPKEAINICIDKDETKEVLEKANVPVPKGKSFNTNDSDEDIITYTNNLGYPVVLKPTDAGGGAGVIINIKDEAAFKKALNTLRYELKYENLMVEQYVLGHDYRIYVIDSKIVGAFKRMPANVIGDGVNNIKKLIRKKNKIRKESPFIYFKPIKIDKNLRNHLEATGLTLESIPKKNERVFLREKGHFMAGGDPIDVTDQLTDEIKKIALDAVHAVPGLVQCGVDIIVDEENNTGVINELNSKAQISNHLFPLEGVARDVPKDIIDYYFPASKEVKRNELLYFDLQPILDAFQSYTARKMELPKIPVESVDAKRMIVKGNLKNSNYKKWIKQNARKHKLHGFVRDMENGNVLIVVTGTVKNITKFKSLISHQSPKKVVVKDVIEKPRTTPVPVGFEIKDIEKPETEQVQEQSNELFTQQNNELKRQINELSREKDMYKKKVQQMQSSSSWKVTLPIRIAKKVIHTMNNKKSSK